VEIFDARTKTIESDRFTRRRIVWKMGTSTLCHTDGTVREELLRSFALQSEALREQHIASVFVSSGAVAVGRLRSPEISDRNLLAAIGQPLMTLAWNKAFYPRPVAQFLFSENELEDRNGIRERIAEALRHDVVPVINCVNPDVNNDSVSVQVAHAIEAEKLALLTTTHGILRNGSSIAEVTHKQQVIDAFTKDLSQGGTGGMEAKCDAALSFVKRGGRDAVIAHGHDERILQEIATGNAFRGTRFM